MGLRLGECDGYPAGVSGSDPHFYDEFVDCQRCGSTVVADVECSECGVELDIELGQDEPDEDHYPERAGR